MPITWHEDAGGNVAHFEGDADVACSAEMKRLLTEAFSSTQAVRVDLSRAGDLDITAIQLLWGAHLNLMADFGWRDRMDRQAL